jgi:cellulose synthase/poly-beta-1,6-N-acetylglucosamine synthase-like glycosyltransferase
LIVPSIISLLLTAVYLVVVSYLIKGWSNLKRPKTEGAPLNTKVTILIAARNEEEGIHYTIEDILAQDYPSHLTEVIIVDDHSTDSTAEIIRSYANRGIKLMQLQEDEPLNSYKKKAIAEAIARSTGDLMGSKWLSSVVAYYETHNLVMISSPVTYFEERSLFERLQTLEFAYLIGIGGAFIGNGRASNCNGANLAYRKDVFHEVGGFKGIDDLASGDDELLLQKIAVVYPKRIGFLKNTDAVVYTHAKHTLQEFLQQRRRWASKSTRYKDKKIVALAIAIWLFNLSMLANALLGFYNISFFVLFLVQYLLKYLFEAAYLLPITSFFQRSRLVALLVILIPVHIIYFVYIGLMGNTRKYSWKGRVVR